MKQKEYDQWNDPQEFYSDDYFLTKKGVGILHEYLVKCYHILRYTVANPTSLRNIAFRWLISEYMQLASD